MTKIRHFFVKIAIFSSILAFFACSNPLSITKDNDFRSAKGTDQLSIVISGGEYGVTEPNGELTFKVGTSFEISFTENDGFQFEKWEVVNSTTGKPVNDVIKIEEIKETETQITVQRASENILLRPVCKIRPKLQSSIPDFKDSGVFRDSIIVLTFDSEISEDSFYYNIEEITNLEANSILKTDDDKIYGYISNNQTFYKNVKITSKDDENLLDYFEPPVIENGKVIKIKPKADMVLLQPTQNYLDIDVCISPDVVDVNGVSIGAKGVQWRYRINPNTDTIPPEITKFTLSKSKTEELESGKNFNPLNHIKNTLYYNCAGKDEGSGISYLEVVSQRIQDTAGVKVDDEPVSTILEKLEGEFVLHNEDGLVQVSFKLYDMSGNSSTPDLQYLVAKDTTVDLSSAHFYNRHSFKLSENITPDTLISAAKTVCWKDIQDDVWYKDNKTLSQDLTYSLYWGTEENKYPNKIECQKNYNYKNGEWFVEIPSVNTGNLYLKLTVSDSVGNEAFITSSILANPSYFTYQKVIDGGEYKYTDEVSGKEKTIPYPALYRIFSAENNVPGYLYYQYEGDETLKTQSFLNIDFDESTGNVNYNAKQFFDFYTDDISKCKFYFQATYASETFTESLEMDKEFQTVKAKIQQKQTLESFLKDLESYNPDLRNAYLIAKIKGRDEAAEQIVKGFYYWDFLVKNKQESYFTTLFFSPLTSFAITESKNARAPVIDSIKIVKGNVNSGVNKATIGYETSAPSGKIYGFFWGDSENNIVNYEKSETFNIKSGISTLYFKTVTIDTSTGENVVGPVSVYDISDYAFDTAAPQIGGYERSEVSQNPNEYRASEYYPVVTCEICYDDYPLVDGKAAYTLYVVPAESLEQTFDQLSEETIRNSPSLINTFIPPADKDKKVLVWNNVEGLGSADAYFYVIYLEDISGNYSYNPLSLSKQILGRVPSVSISQSEDDESLVEIDFAIEKEVGYRDYQYEYNIFATDEENVVYYPCEGNVAAKDSFFFAYAKAIYQLGELNLTKYSYPVYFYSGNETCNMKDVIDGLNGAQIYCDKPCLVMTYWSSENYGYEIQDWEAFGVQSNIMYISAKNSQTNEYEETVKYYTINYDEIPMGKYFVVIAHFADGSALMTRKINTN